MSITRLSSTIYPDQTFSLGIVPAPKKETGTGRFHAAYFDIPDKRNEDYENWLLGASKIGGKFCSLTAREESDPLVLHHRHITPEDMQVLEAMDNWKTRAIMSEHDVPVPSEAPLLVKSPKSSRKKRDPYGRHGITTFGKKLTSNACLLLQRKWGKSRLGFLTATLPPVDADLCRTIIANWSDISRRFYQKIRRICEKRGCEFIYVGCTEIQEKRFASTSIPVPHLHAVYVSKRRASDGYIFSTRDAYEAWNDAVNEVLVLRGREPIMGTGKHKGSVKLEPIRKSASAYIGKYISKGCAVTKAMVEKGYNEFPKQWWTACMQCKKMFKDSLIRPNADINMMLFYDAESLLENGFFTWMHSIWIEVGGASYRCGITGTLSYDAYQWIKSQG